MSWRRTRWAVVVALALVVGHGPSAADKSSMIDGDGQPPPSRNNPIRLGMISALLVEAAIPDIRHEWVDQGEDGWVLSWPLHLVQHRFGRIQLSLFGEPQLRVTGENQARLLGGVRLTAVPLRGVTFALVAEAGGLLGQDGDGGFAGGGIAWDMFGLGDEGDELSELPTLSVVYRQVFTGDADRRDVALDLLMFAVDLPFRRL